MPATDRFRAHANSESPAASVALRREGQQAQPPHVIWQYPSGICGAWGGALMACYPVPTAARRPACQAVRLLLPLPRPAAHLKNGFLYEVLAALAELVLLPARRRGVPIERGGVPQAVNHPAGRAQAQRSTGGAPTTSAPGARRHAGRGSRRRGRASARGPSPAAAPRPLTAHQHVNCAGSMKVVRGSTSVHVHESGLSSSAFAGAARAGPGSSSSRSASGRAIAAAAAGLLRRAIPARGAGEVECRRRQGA